MCNVKKHICLLLVTLLVISALQVSTFADDDTEVSPIFEAENITIEQGEVEDLTSSASAVLSLTEATIVIRYTSTGSNAYQSLFSVSNSTSGNQNRHFHIYVTPSGVLGMELRNTDDEFKYTMSASGAVSAGTENIIAFSADSETGTYKLFANGALVSTLSKDDYKFFTDITGLDTVSLGGTIRAGSVGYPFAGTISSLEIYNVALSDDDLIDATYTDASISASNISITEGSVYDLTDEDDAQAIMNLTQGTIVIRYTCTGSNDYQSLFSVSNSTSGNTTRHFHLYITPDGVLGFELRNTDSEFKYTSSRASSVRSTYLSSAAENTVAFKADATTGSYKLFANGQLISTLTPSAYKFFADITGLDTISLGGTIRDSAVAYPFAGTISSALVTSEVLSDQELISLTAETTYGTLIFSDASEINSNYYRIPSLLTLKSGTVVAAVDARYGGTHDSKSNIDTAFSRSTDNGATWSEPILPLCFDDYAAQEVDWPTESGTRDLQIQGSASFIDPVMVQDEESGRLYLFADVMPAGIGSSNASIGNGYTTIDGVQYLKLRWYEDDSDTYNYSVRENGVIYNDTTNTATEYTVNSDFEILQNGTPLTVEQYTVSISGSTLTEEHNNVDVAMNVFYQDAYFKVYPTTYLGMTYSDDEGVTWSSMQLLNTLKSDSEKLLITGPGVGIQIENGNYAGRLVVPVYSVTLAGFGVIYSDDGGTTWQYSAADSSSTGATAEAQLVEMPDGSLKAYVRTSSGYIAERTSIDGGISWTAETAISGVSSTSYGTQLSVINYSGLIDGQSAIIMSTPNSTSGRNTGIIRIGLITDTGSSGTDRYSINWAYTFTIDGTVGFSYSCLAELSNGSIGLLYEKYDSWARTQLHLKNVIPFETYTISQLTSTT